MRERGLAAALPVVAVAAIAVPAWAGGGAESKPEVVAASAAGERFEVLVPSEKEREEIDRCLSEQGFEPPSRGDVTIAPHPPHAPAARELEGFAEAAEECGLPAPPMPAGEAHADGHAIEACALPAPPPVHERGR